MSYDKTFEDYEVYYDVNNGNYVCKNCDNDNCYNCKFISNTTDKRKNEYGFVVIF